MESETERLIPYIPPQTTVVKYGTTVRKILIIINNFNKCIFLFQNDTDESKAMGIKPVQGKKLPQYVAALAGI